VTAEPSRQESARLDTLRSCAILDTKPEPDFDDLAAVAASVTGASTAVVAFVDETRWWVKARVGDVPASLSRAAVLCQAAFERGEALVIDDLAAYDFRPSVPEVGDGARAYAALPLVVDGGLPVGVLCVAGPTPHAFGTIHVAALARIARHIARLLSFRRHAALLAEAHEALAIGEAQYRLLADTAPDAIITVDDVGRVVFANPATERLFGYAPAELVGQPFSVLAPEPERQGHLDAFVAHAEGLKAPLALSGYRVTGARRDGETFAMEVSCGEGRAGTSRFFTGILRDVGDRHAAEQALVEARERAEQASRLKSEFLANMSHEIRTPMNGIMGMLDLVLEESLTAGQRAKVERARESAQALLGIINDILDLSKIEAGRMDLHPSWMDPSAAVRDVSALLRPLAATKGLTLDVTCADDLPPHVLVDGGRLQQVLINLTGNAVKFTDQGGVTIEAGVTRLSAGRADLRFTVRDTGIGIPVDQIGLVFEKFTQLNGAANRRSGGTGLGLSICTRLVDLMGGQIGVTSEPGRGSTFWIDLSLECTDGVVAASPGPSEPLAPAVAPAPTLADPAGAAPRRARVLLVEDNPVNQQYASAVLRSAGHTVTVVGNGQEAVEQVQALAPDLILMDCQMPVMDGFEATRRIRAAGLRMPIVALTANAMDEDRQRCVAAGMNDVLVKPIRPDTLRAAVAGTTVGGGDEPRDVGLDIEALVVRLGGDRALFADIGHLFVHHSDDMLDAVTGAASRGDVSVLASAAHVLKGSISSFTQGSAYQSARQVEDAAREGRLAEAVALVPTLAREVGRLRAGLLAAINTEVGVSR